MIREVTSSHTEESRLPSVIVGHVTVDALCTLHFDRSFPRIHSRPIYTILPYITSRPLSLPFPRSAKIHWHLPETIHQMKRQMRFKVLGIPVFCLNSICRSVKDRGLSGPRGKQRSREPNTVIDSQTRSLTLLMASVTGLW